MLIIGESLNAAIPKVGEAIISRDEAYIAYLAHRQVECGAQMLDICASLAGRDEAEDLIWTVQVVQRAVAVPLVLDSADPTALLAALPFCHTPPILSSATGEEARLHSLLKGALEANCDLVVLCMDENGIPPTAAGRLEVARRVLEQALQAGMEPGRLWFDPLVTGIATDSEAGQVALETLRLIRKQLPGARTLAAVSNVSFGLPKRRLLNRTFLAMLVANGVEAILMDVRDRALLSTLYAAAALVGHDQYCKAYLQAYRAGKLE